MPGIDEKISRRGWGDIGCLCGVAGERYLAHNEFPLRVACRAEVFRLEREETRNVL